MLSLHLPSSDRPKSGGGAYVVHRLANGLSERGHAVTVFTTDERPADARYQVRRVPAHFASPPAGPGLSTRNVLHNWLQNWQVAFGYARQNFSAFDVIHAHGDDALIWKPGPPVVRTFQGSAMDEAIHAPTWKKRLWYLTFAPREVWEAAKATVRVAGSTNTRRYIPCIDLVIPNGVDCSVFHAGKGRAPHPTILFVGTLAGRKRGQMLLDIFQSQIRPALPSAQLWLVAEQRVEAPGVVCFQQPDENALAGLYRQTWIFCLPSTYEGFGVPYIEALACGTPVVATPNLGAREVLEDGKWGVLASLTDLGPTLLSLLQDAQKREQLSQQGLKRAEDFDLDTIVAAYESLFQDTVQRHQDTKRTV